MKRLVFLSVVLILLAACGGQTPAQATLPKATDTPIAIPPTATNIPPLPTPSPTPQEKSDDLQFTMREFEEITPGWYYGKGNRSQEIEPETVSEGESSLNWAGSTTLIRVTDTGEICSDNGHVIQITSIEENEYTINFTIITTCLVPTEFLVISYFSDTTRLWDPTAAWFFSLPRTQDDINA